MKYDPSYPLVQEADEEIAETQAAIKEAEKTKYMNQTTDRDPTYELLREDIAKTSADLASQKATASAVAQSIDSMNLKMVDLDQKAVKQSDLLREAKANEANYLLYLSKREQEKTSDALDQKRIANVAIVFPPICRYCLHTARCWFCPSDSCSRSCRCRCGLRRRIPRSVVPHA